MRNRALVLALAALAPSPCLVRAEGLSIEHKPVGCVVAGSYPRLNACFAPASRLARARVYFRLLDGPPDWYYVEMKSDAPCHSGVLPKPKSQLVGRRLQYYLGAVDRGFAEARTGETEALVVSRASECDPKLLAAPALEGAAVAVFPGVPAGFAGAAGLGAATTVAVVGGGAALLGGGIAVAAGGSDSQSAAPAAVVTGPPEQIPVPPPITTTTTTLAPGDFVPVFKVLKGGVPLDLSATIAGSDPMPLAFDMCESTGPFKLLFDVEVDGAKLADGCRSTITFGGAGATASRTRSGLRALVSGRIFDVRMHVKSATADSDPQAGKRVSVQVDSTPTTTTTTTLPPGGCSGDTTGPLAQVLHPTAGSAYPPGAFPIHFEAAADDSTTGNNGIAQLEYKVNWSGVNPILLPTPPNVPPWPVDWTRSEVDAYLAGFGVQCGVGLTVLAYAVDNCGNASYSAEVPFTVSASACPPAAPAAQASRSSTWVSELSLPGGSGQVVVNGEAAFAREGRSPLAARLQPGENRVEATLVEGRSPGSWRFELSGLPGLQEESLRVIAGEVAQLGGGSLVFRLRGRPGERMVFSFRVAR